MTRFRHRITLEGPAIGTGGHRKGVTSPRVPSRWIRSRWVQRVYIFNSKYWGKKSKSNQNRIVNKKSNRNQNERKNHNCHITIVIIIVNSIRSSVLQWSSVKWLTVESVRPRGQISPQSVTCTNNKQRLTSSSAHHTASLGWWCCCSTAAGRWLVNKHHNQRSTWTVVIIMAAMAIYSRAVHPLWDDGKMSISTSLLSTKPLPLPLPPTASSVLTAVFNVVITDCGLVNWLHSATKSTTIHCAAEFRIQWTGSLEQFASNTAR